MSPRSPQLESVAPILSVDDLPAALDALVICDGTDPEGNVFQISNRPA